MPGLYRYLIIAPVADQAGVQAATGFHTGSPLYTEADAQPRTQSHGWTATAFTTEQEALIETPVTGARAQFPDTVFVKYHAVSEKSVPETTRASMGLTVYQTDPAS